MPVSTLRQNLIPQEFLQKPQQVRVIAENRMNALIERAVPFRPTQTPGPAKTIVEVMNLIRQAISDYELRSHVTEDAKIDVVYSKPDIDQKVEAISIELVRREPGMWGQGRPFENDVKALRPILREQGVDPDHPNYRLLKLGYFYDNMLRLTCWARTNRAANDRALWLENIMEEYTWFLTYSGVNRVLYQGRQEEIVHEVNNNKFYGRPIDYFVRTEKIRQVSEKTFEDICIRFSLGDAPK